MRATASDVSIRPYRLSRVEYGRAVEAGAFEPDAKLELIDEGLHGMTPEGSRHAAVMDIVAHHLQRVFGLRFHVRIQHPTGGRRLLGARAGHRGSEGHGT